MDRSLHRSSGAAAARAARVLAGSDFLSELGFSFGLCFSPKFYLDLLVFSIFQTYFYYFFNFLMGFSLEFNAYGLFIFPRYLSLIFSFTLKSQFLHSLREERRYHVELIPPIGLLGRRKPMDRHVVSL